MLGQTPPDWGGSRGVILAEAAALVGSSCAGVAPGRAGAAGEAAQDREPWPGYVAEAFEAREVVAQPGSWGEGVADGRAEPTSRRRPPRCSSWPELGAPAFLGPWAAPTKPSARKFRTCPEILCPDEAGLEGRPGPFGVPEWRGTALASEFLLRVADVKPHTLFDAVCELLKEGSADFSLYSEVHEAQAVGAEVVLRATAFVDLQPVEVEARVYHACPGADTGHGGADRGCVPAPLRSVAAVAVLRHPPCSDVVLFRHVVVSLALLLQGRGLRLLEANFNTRGLGALTSVPQRAQSDADLVGGRAPEEWLPYLEPALSDLESPSTERAAQAAVSLARLARALPDCRPTLAEALVTRADLVSKIFSMRSRPSPRSSERSWLAVQYPVAVVAGLLSEHCQAAERASPLLPLFVERLFSEADVPLPVLVKGELLRTISRLSQLTSQKQQAATCRR